MRVPVSWLRDYADLPADVDATRLAAALVRAGLEVERVEPMRIGGPVVVGEVLDFTDEPQRNGKTIRWCQVEVGEDAPRGIVCGALNFDVGDRVVVALPGAVLAGGFQIGARKTYGHVSDGMICAEDELGVGTDHTGIIVLADKPDVGTDAARLLDLRDDVLDIAVTPDRSYCLSVRGVAREAATAFGVAFRDPADLAVPTSDGGHPVVVDDPVGCDRYVARVVTDIDPAAPSPLWLRRRLHLAGMRAISLAVDVTNHVLLDLGQPLHAFDRPRLAGSIVVRRARPGERLTTLDGVDRALHPDDLVIADTDGPVALAGVMGGARAEVSAATTSVVIEAAHFDPVSVARTSRRHRLTSEASRRFERGVDDAVAPAAAQAAVDLLATLGGGIADGGVTDVDARAGRPLISLRVDAPATVAGRDYAPEVVRRRLTDVGCEVTGDDALTVTPPSWRPDLRDPADLVEEVLRLEGYDTIPTALPRAAAGRGLSRRQRLTRAVGRTLAAAGYVEVLTYPFVGAAALDALQLPADDERRRVVRLANPLSDDEPALRPTLLPGLLAALARNAGRGNPELMLFELGPVFRAGPVAAQPPTTWPTVEGRPDEAELARLHALLPAQPRHVAVVAAGEAEPAGWWGPGRPACWADAVQAARDIAATVGVALDVLPGSDPVLHPGRCAVLRSGGRPVGTAGELHPRAVAALDLPARTVVMELDLDALLADDPGVVPAPQVSTYPVSHRDVALVVADDVPAAAVEAALRGGAGPLLESLRLFDRYVGAQVPAGHRSLAYALHFRAPDRTLTDDEVNAARDAAIAAAAERTGATLRG